MLRSHDVEKRSNAMRRRIKERDKSRGVKEEGKQKVKKVGFLLAALLFKKKILLREVVMEPNQQLHLGKCK